MTKDLIDRLKRAAIPDTLNQGLLQEAAEVLQKYLDGTKDQT